MWAKGGMGGQYSVRDFCTLFFLMGQLLRIWIYIAKYIALLPLSWDHYSSNFFIFVSFCWDDFAHPSSPCSFCSWPVTIHRRSMSCSDQCRRLIVSWGYSKFDRRLYTQSHMPKGDSIPMFWLTIDHHQLSIKPMPKDE